MKDPTGRAERNTMMCARTRHDFRYLLLIAAAVAAWLPARPAHAAVYTYSTRQRTINAGILMADDLGSGMGEGYPTPTAAQITMGTNNPDPYVFYILNQRSDIKPLGWNIVNPLASPTVTGDIQARWDARTSNSATGSAFLAGNGGHAYPLGQAITPNMAPYWEVSLSRTGLDDLLQFDVLLLNLQGRTVRLTMSETEKLRRFVDGGGQLWVEDSGSGQIANDPNAMPYGPAFTPFYGPLFFDVQFNNGAAAGQAALPPAAGVPVLVRHPIIDTPNLLSQNELNGLGVGSHIQSTIIGVGLSVPDTSLLTTVVGNGAASDLPVIAAGQLGAGQVVVTTTGSSAAINNAVGGIDCGFGPNSGPFCGNTLLAAPAADLKFVSDILSWDTAHPTEHKTSHQSSQSRSNLGPAVTPIWNYPTTAPAGGANFTPGAALNGDYVYVRGVDGLLHAFNAEPGTDLLGTGTPDAGYLDYTKGDPYDEIWNTGGHAFSVGASTLSLSDPYASAPTVASIPGGETLVFIEGQDGSVYAADAVTGAPYSSSGVTGGKLPGSGQSTGGAGGGATLYTTVAPAPTVYDGYVYAGQPNGKLYVFSFVTSTASGGVTYQVGGSTEPIIAPPAVGIVRDDVSGTPVDDIVAAVTTNLGVYTVMLGARHDLVQYNANPSNMGYSPKQVGLGAGSYPSFDATYAPSRLYGDNGNGYPAYVSGAPFLFPASPPPPTFFADYNVDFSQATGAGTSLTRAQFDINPSAIAFPNYTPKAATNLSAPALASSGYFYYTATLPGAGGADSTLVCAHDTRTSNAAQATNRLFWRFRLPFSGEADPVDADGISYAGLQGYTFQGAPVVDSQGNVFALAVNTNSGLTAVLCFNGTQAVSVQAVNPGQVAPNTVSIAFITQPVAGSTNDEFGNTPQALAGTLQYSGTPDSNGNVTFFNFGAITNGATLNPNVSEPEPVAIAYTSTTGNGAATVVSPSAPMHTNMAWVAPLPVAATSGLTLVGNYLFFGDAAGNLYRLYAYPQEAGLIGANRAVSVGTLANPTRDTNDRPIFAAVATTAGSINGVPSAGNNAMIVNGTTGIVALSSRYTLVADSNRILEVDSDGLASWAVDSTGQPGPNGTVTHLDLNRPSSVFQQAPNDYLVADTGNNRCVRFDRSGNVLWELSRFNDVATTTSVYSSPSGTYAAKPNALLTPGEPTSLNHPTSVQTYLTYTPDTTNNGRNTIVHYLIADTGNYRILEVVDIYNGLGQPVGPPHNLVWLSHTFDRQGRPYRYTSASYFAGPPDASGLVKEYVAALVSNERLALPLPAATTPASGQLGPASADAPGSSLVLLDYAPVNGLGTASFGSGGQADGFVAAAASSFFGYFLPNGQFDINGAPKLTASGQSTATGTPTPRFLRNPRFLQTYTPPGGTGALQNFLFADDNGVFDLFLNTSVTPHRFEAQWGFTQADYQNVPDLGTVLVNGVPTTQLVHAPIDVTLPSPGVPFQRNGHAYLDGAQLTAPIAFLPSSLQRIGTEQVTDTAGTYLMGHYIVANGYSQGEVTPISGFGGEALELNDIAFGGALVTQDYASFSKPANTSPLSQPAFAIREK